MCHLIFLAPVLALPVFWLLPFSVALPIYLGVLGLTTLITWPVIGALRRSPVTGREGMVGVRGEALTMLNPRGLVRCQGEVWEATAEESIPGGERVWVLGIRHLLLTVGRHAPRATECCSWHGGSRRPVRVPPERPEERQ
ncbi:MAG TPA: NfeD family protein [Candidatus Methylomirabilis sp.]|nr:NfeD family protein [Candidatus Methylomirabilis sp.]